MNIFASNQRPHLLEQIAETEYDLLVIGGGATGSGIALDAASRGLRTLLVEMEDFASGTSSRSTKLIHGGLRYLKQFEIALVREVGRERAIVHRLAPHLVVSEKMLLPLVKGGTYGRFATSVGLMVYDVLAGVERPEQRVMLSKEETMELEPNLRTDILEGSGLYAEYRTDDARLTVEVLKTASLYGAHSLNYAKVEDFLYEDDLVVGAVCLDRLSGQRFQVKARQVVSAAGPWVDELREKNNSMTERHLFLSKGVHLVVPHEKLPINQSIYFDVPDGRMIFAIPRGKITYIGTTDTEYRADKNHVLTREGDVTYLVEAVNHTFPDVHLQASDVISSWAGLRPLIFEEGKSASEISRKDEIFESPTNLISIAGGKLTGYRKMAERVVDTVVKKLRKGFHVKVKDCHTDTIVIKGGGFKDGEDVEQYKQAVLKQLAPHGFDAYDAEYLVHNYGQQTDTILEWFFERDTQDALALARTELAFGFEYEMVVKPLDFFSRRSGRLYFDIQSIRDLMDPLLADFQAYFGWDEGQLAEEKAILGQAVHE
ncbi:MAG: glycerol-3-phosphate dehydrogenase/oxidase, partial [Bacteroidota bacterium]